ncbi:nucleotidyltransferase substrate binding protein [Dechloromonas sp. HYN0024]|uniref:nucleotidyltransferase substrate binding protein n=1 Tax=Dechloromonas sp. HYN0024 TaxID=2231055 RepID=UPI001F07AD7C|nr:nucleotidyltransferase substrate binding protein [Dechloromonas sp. HYN0024]
MELARLFAVSSSEQDVRWLQRLSNYSQALQRLSDAVELAAQRALSPLEQQGVIQAFEFTHELAWNVMKDFFHWQGNAAIAGSRDATREAYAKGLVEDGDGWMAMIKSRNQSSHTYNQAIAEAIVGAVIGQYHALLVKFERRMQQIGGQ